MNIYTEIPPLAATTKQFNGWLTSIHLEVRELTPEERREYDIPDGQDAWTAHDVFYNHANPLNQNDYGHMVSAIVRSSYSEDDVEAILNNYLATPDTHREEFERLQSWRDTAKATARQIIESIN